MGCALTFYGFIIEKAAAQRACDVCVFIRQSVCARAGYVSSELARARRARVLVWMRAACATRVVCVRVVRARTKSGAHSRSRDCAKRDMRAERICVRGACRYACIRVVLLYTLESYAALGLYVAADAYAAAGLIGGLVFFRFHCNELLHLRCSSIPTKGSLAPPSPPPASPLVVGVLGVHRDLECACSRRGRRLPQT